MFEHPSRREDENRRNQSLRELLEARRRGLAEDVHRRMIRIRQSGITTTRTTEPEPNDGDDLDLSLLEIAATTLRRVDDAIERLDAGRYGRCLRCHGEIAEARLRAVPFAVRCQQCEVTREQELREREATGRKWRWVADAVDTAARDEA